MATKQKYSQHDLRRLMQEQKSKANVAQGAAAKRTRIDSPLAKYNDLGQLTCVLCQSVVRSEDVWKVHLNAKQHKENVLKAKELKERAERQAAAPKRSAPPPADNPVPEKKPKGILKNATTPVAIATNPIPSSTVPSSSTKHDTSEPIPAATKMDVVEGDAEAGDAALPEGFFDDPKKDALARNLEYKDPVQEEWDRFQKEIREAATVSNEIMAEDQEESTAERQIVEIDEQIRNWNRVLTMEKRKEERLKRLERAKPKAPKKEESEEESEVDEDVTEGDEVDEFGNWRAKGWNKSK